MTTTSVNPTPSASPAGSAQPLLEIKDLEITFTTSNGPVKGVRSANLEVYPGETVAIVGESGSGKSTTAMAIAHLLAKNGAITGGQILFEGRDITHVSEKEIRVLRGDQVGLVPQDPMSNLNPMWRVGAQTRETLAANGVAKGAEARKRTVQLLEEAGLSDAERRAEQFPHEHHRWPSYSSRRYP